MPWASFVTAMCKQIGFFNWFLFWLVLFSLERICGRSQCFILHFQMFYALVLLHNERMTTKLSNGKNVCFSIWPSNFEQFNLKKTFNFRNKRQISETSSKREFNKVWRCKYSTGGPFLLSLLNTKVLMKLHVLNLLQWRKAEAFFKTKNCKLYASF